MMVMLQFCRLFVPFWCGERPRGRKARLLGVWRGTYNVQRWKHKVGFHNRGVQWVTSMARWAGEGNDWIKLMAQQKPRREDVVRSLLESMKQPVVENGTQRDQAGQETRRLASP